MRKIIFQYTVIIVAMMVWSCSSSQNNSIKGVIVDATMNTLLIKTSDGDTVVVSTVDADVTADDGILIGDSAQVWVADIKAEQLLANKVVVTFAARATLEGAWVETVPGMDSLVQGFDLGNGGEASSINMATLQYSSWSQLGDSIVLVGKSIGNGQTIDFVDTMYIEKLTIDSLVLTNGSMMLRYSKQK